MAVAVKKIAGVNRVSVKKVEGNKVSEELAASSLRGDANLVYYCRFEGNSNDAVGSLNGTDTSITYGTSYGKFNQGANFNGTSSKIALGTATILNFAGAYTWNFWLNPTSSQPDPYAYIFYKTINLFLISDGGAFNNSWYYDNGQGGGFNRAIGSAGSVTYDTWQMITITRDSNDLVTLYKNATSLGTVTDTQDPSGNVYWGSQTGSNRFFKGSMDDISIYSRNWSSTEVTNTYNSQVKKFAGVSNV